MTDYIVEAKAGGVRRITRASCNELEMAVASAIVAACKPPFPPHITSPAEQHIYVAREALRAVARHFKIDGDLEPVLQAVLMTVTP